MKKIFVQVILIVLPMISSIGYCQIIDTVAGTGIAGFAGDNGPAGNARLNNPTGVAIDGAGNVYISDYNNHRIRRIMSGIITTFAGTGSSGSSGDGGPAVNADLNLPSTMVFFQGDMYVVDAGNHAIRRIDMNTGNITTVAGVLGSGGFSGDNGPATLGRLNFPCGLAFDAAGNMFIADRNNNRIRMVTPPYGALGVITTVVGTGAAGFGGDSGAPTSAQLNNPNSVSFDQNGALYIADKLNNRIRRVANGIITTFAGNGALGSAGDNGLAINAELNNPYGATFDVQGANLYISDLGNTRIRRIRMSTGRITRYAGTTSGFSGDGGPAILCQLSSMEKVAFDANNNMYVPDAGNHRVRVISPCSRPINGLSVLTSLNGTHSNTSFILTEDITLSASTILRNSEILMLPDITITVPPGMVLNLDHSHLFACGDHLWQGIVIKDGGQIITSNTRRSNSMIEDAIVAIDVDTISTAAATPPININKLVFNKNYIGIRLRNSDPAMTSLGLGITECVFSSRDMPFTTSPAALSWPSADASSTGLRFMNPTAMAGLAPPCALLGYFQDNLRSPFQNQDGHIGIQIENIGDPNGVTPSTGVDIGITYPSGANQFNLFDGLGNGIDVTNASLTTYNNVFQNMTRYAVTPGGPVNFGGHGIFHHVTTLMNARLDLIPTTPSTSFGNQFWDCWIGVFTDNVYEVKIHHGIFRSTRNISNTAFGPGSDGMVLFSNRFKYDIQHCEFNNISLGVIMVPKSAPYDMGSGLSTGTYADDVEINQNYFGPEVASSTSIGQEHCSQAIRLTGVNGGNWQIAGACKILSNKLDRVFRGIRINQMEDYPIEVGGNTIKVIDEPALSLTEQHGIYADDSRDNLFINQNTVKGEGYQTNPANWNQRLILIRSVNNISASQGQSPIITCNQVSDAYVGFEFEGPQPNTVWIGNTMFQQMHKGLHLINNATIGTQGSLSQACADRWYELSPTGPDSWNANWQTYVTSSNANGGSFLYCENPMFNVAFPFTNGSNIPGTQFMQPTSLAPNSHGADCLYYTVYPTVPAQRTSTSGEPVAEEQAGIESDLKITIFPNPSNGRLNIAGTGGQVLYVKIMDLSGRVVYVKDVNSHSAELDISSLAKAAYFIEVQDQNQQITRKKLLVE